VCAKAQVHGYQLKGESAGGKVLVDEGFVDQKSKNDSFGQFCDQ